MTKPKSKPAKPPTLAELRKAARRVYGKRYAYLNAYESGHDGNRVWSVVDAYGLELLLVRAKDEPAARRDLLTCLEALEKSR